MAMQKVTIKALLKKKTIKERSSSQAMTSEKSCVCSPTNHAGSFRFRLHRTSGAQKAYLSSMEEGEQTAEQRRFNTKKIVRVRLDNGQKSRLSRFAEAAGVSASKDDKQRQLGTALAQFDLSGGEVLVSSNDLNDRCSS